MEIAKHETDFFMRLETLQTPRSFFEAQSGAHGDIDLRLVQRIEDLLVPALGPWEQSDQWFHQIDYYGDGVRSLTFRRSVFPFAFIPALQGLLCGEHERFCILCIASDKLCGASPAGGSAREDDYLAIFSNRMLATKELGCGLQ
jgi:hypothetical protein